MNKSIVLLSLSVFCLAISGAVMACSVFRSCPEVPLSRLNSGTYMELVPVPSGQDGRMPRLTQKDWPHKQHPYQSAPDMRMDVDVEKKLVTVTYTRDGDKVVERWRMGKVTR